MLNKKSKLKVAYVPFPVQCQVWIRRSDSGILVCGKG